MQDIFNAHARQYENEFMEDLVNLNVRMPDALTRVTEYVPQVAVQPPLPKHSFTTQMINADKLRHRPPPPHPSPLHPKPTPPQPQPT